MPYIGFNAFSAGAAVANVSIVCLAVLPPGKAFKIQGTGGGIATVAGVACSSDSGGTMVPNADASGRAFPPSLAGKTVVFEVAPGIPFRSYHHIKLAVRSLHGVQATLYEWEGRIPLSSDIPAGFSVEGTAEEVYHNQDGGSYFDLVMYGDADDSSILDRAAARSGRGDLVFDRRSMAPRVRPTRSR